MQIRSIASISIVSLLLSAWPGSASGGGCDMSGSSTAEDVVLGLEVKSNFSQLDWSLRYAGTENVFFTLHGDTSNSVVNVLYVQRSFTSDALWMDATSGCDSIGSYTAILTTEFEGFGVITETLQVGGGSWTRGLTYWRTKTMDSTAFDWDAFVSSHTDVDFTHTSFEKTLSSGSASNEAVMEATYTFGRAPGPFVTAHVSGTITFDSEGHFVLSAVRLGRKIVFSGEEEIDMDKGRYATFFSGDSVTSVEATTWGLIKVMY